MTPTATATIRSMTTCRARNGMAHRVSTRLIDYMGAADTALNHAIGRLWLIAAVRRARKPGTKFDQMIVFEDKEGTGKSTAFRVLAVKDEWFTDQVPLTGSYKDVQELLAGIWIAEMGRACGIAQSRCGAGEVAFSLDVSTAGAAPYKRKTKAQGRTCVFGGSTNDAKYLKSTTGNRRFWPVKTGRVDLVALKRDREQLWAEAAKLEAEGVTSVLDELLVGRSGESAERAAHGESLHRCAGGTLG